MKFPTIIVVIFLLALSVELSVSTSHVTSPGTSEQHNLTDTTTQDPNNTNTATTDHHDTKDQGGDRGGHGKLELVPVHFDHVKYPLVFTIVVILAGLSKLGFHYSHFLSSKVPESCVLILIGVIMGAILYFTGVSDTLTLYSPHEFFLFLLPPIVLEAAFSLHDRTFAENIGGVLLFAVLGTILNCFAIGFTLYGLYQGGLMEEINCSLIQILVFSSLIVAVDPVAVLAVFQEVGVNTTLYFLVFGESLLNDGVTVVMYNVLQTFNRMDQVGVTEIFLGVLKFIIVCCGGTMIGIVMALISAFITKFTNSVKVVEPLIIYGFAYLSYILSELFEFSGILSMTVCGIIQIHYAYENITNKSRITTKFIAKVMANASEIVIFMFLGLVTIQPNHEWKTGFTLWTALLCIVYRFIITFCISIAINHYSSGRVRKIKHDEMFMISYGGLRGAVCFSLVALINEDEIPMKKMFVTTTLFIVFFTVFVQGGTIKWLVKKMRISLAEQNKDMSLNEELSNHVFDHVMAGIEEILGYTTGTHHLKEKLDHIDDHVIKPRLLRNATSSDLTDISHYYEKLVMKEHFKNLQLGGAKGLPRVKTEIRHLDSELALDQLVHDVDERTAHDRHEKLHEKRTEEHMQRNVSFGDNHMHLKVHDKNIVHDHKHKLVTHLRNKHKRNKKLLQIKTRTQDTEMRESEVPDAITVDDTVERKSSQVQFQLHDTVYENEAYEGNGSQDESQENGKVMFSL